MQSLAYVIWILAFIAFGIAEGVTEALVSIWFLIGSLAGLIAAVCGAKALTQLWVFVIVSGLSLCLTRPFIKKIFSKPIVATNYDRVIGKEGVAIEDITSDTGSAHIDGKDWTVRSLDGSKIQSGERIIVDHIEGVKAMVKGIEEKSVKTR